VRPALENLIQNHPDHPYAQVGLEDIENSLKAFAGLFDPQGYHYAGTPGRNTLLPTGVGSLKPAYLMPSTMSAGKDILSEPTLLIGFQEFGNFYAPYAARSFQRLPHGNGKLPIRGESITLSDIADGKASKASALARQFEEDGFREKVVEKIRNLMKGESLVGFPAVLGLKNAGKVKADLEARLGARVFELPILPPSIPGLRLFEVFKEYFRAKGVWMILGFEVGSPMRKNGKCQGVVLKTPAGEKVHEAHYFVLATGGFFGGGLQVQGDRIVEPLFETAVAQPDSPGEWFQDEFLGPKGHPINKSGVRTNSRLNPLDENGKVLLENLFAAGMILGHHDALREKSMGGVDVATGYKVIRNLLRK